MSDVVRFTRHDGYVVSKAMRYTQDNLAEVLEFGQGAIVETVHKDDCGSVLFVHDRVDKSGWNTCQVSVGDWIIIKDERQRGIRFKSCSNIHMLKRINSHSKRWELIADEPLDAFNLGGRALTCSE